MKLFLLTFILLNGLRAADLSDLTWTIEEGEIVITRCLEGARGVLDIPESIDGLPVSRIEERAFDGCQFLTEVTLTETITSIEDEAFRNCVDLTIVNLPDSVSSIGNFVFHSCFKISSLDIPQRVETIGEGVFRGCGNLASINVDPANVHYRSLDGVLFTSDLSLIVADPPERQAPTYTLPPGVTAIADYAFSSSSRLTSITLPEGLVSTGRESLALCSRTFGYFNSFIR